MSTVSLGLIVRSPFIIFHFPHGLNSSSVWNTLLYRYGQIYSQDANDECIITIDASAMENEEKCFIARDCEDSAFLANIWKGQGQSETYVMTDVCLFSGISRFSSGKRQERPSMCGDGGYSSDPIRYLYDEHHGLAREFDSIYDQLL
jgi:hypothetical protein